MRERKPSCGLELAAHGATEEWLEKVLLSSALKFPVLPEIASRVAEEIDRPGSTAGSLGDIVQVDPALSARILRVANSAAYGGLAQVRDLHRAISRLGSRLVVAIVLGGVSKELLQCEDPRLLEVAAEAWTRSVRAAAFARLVASQNAADPGLAFLAGLLHATGIAVIVQACDTFAGEESLTMPPDDDFHRAVEELHPPVGAQLLENWHLPQMLVEAVRHQVHPGQAEPGAESLAALTGAAGAFAAHAAKTGSSADLTDSLREHSALARLSGDPAGLRELVESALEHAVELQSVLG